jgi:hypothetical protein
MIDELEGANDVVLIDPLCKPGMTVHHGEGEEDGIVYVALPNDG